MTAQVSCPECDRVAFLDPSLSAWTCSSCGRQWEFQWCRECAGAFQLPDGKRASCPWCATRQRPSNEWRATAADLAEELRRRGLSVESPSDPDRRLLRNCIVIGGFGHQLPPNSRVDVIFGSDAVRFITLDDEPTVLPYTELETLRVGGRGAIRSGGGFLGGGFGPTGRDRRLPRSISAQRPHDKDRDRDDRPSRNRRRAADSSVGIKQPPTCLNLIWLLSSPGSIRRGLVEAKPSQRLPPQVFPPSWHS